MKRNASPRIRFVFPLLATLFALLATVSTQAVDTGFLDNHVNDDGSIALSSDVSVSFQSTVESLNTFIEYGEGDVAYINRALAYLNSSSADSSTENILHS
ncbi:hypothetical protein [Gynuella sp.]|uniref:hypothetical protein n=1 Tax=Gynuella sp. TaxID=2969146 RepID=UPI003D0A1D5B